VEEQGGGNFFKMREGQVENEDRTDNKRDSKEIC
jgi:hypothetical protein